MLRDINQFNLSKKDYQNILKAINNRYSDCLNDSYSQAFSDMSIFIDLKDFYKNLTRDEIEEKFHKLFQELMYASDAIYNNGIDTTLWVNKNNPDEYINFKDVKHTIKFISSN